MTHKIIARTLTAALALGTIAAPALAQDHGGYGGGYQDGPGRGGPDGGPDGGPGHWDRGGGGPDDRRHYDLAGRGVPLLYPELRDSPRGRAFVMRNFDLDRDGLIDPREARAADRAFDEMTHGDRAHFAWGDHGDRGFSPPPPPGPPVAEGGWDRQGMRAYHFHQNRYGAMFSMGDVLFQTGSAALRPGAADRLQTLAGYLHAHPGQTVRIDGFTDSVGSASSNVALSHARADSVAHALAEMGVNPARLSLYGHGESDPVASNADAAGRQLNRRVEVTLVGQRADSFN